MGWGYSTIDRNNEVRFIPNEIDNHSSGDGQQAYYSPGITFDEESKKWLKTENWSKPSPFGVWGEMGTIASQEEAASELIPEPF